MLMTALSDEVYKVNTENVEIAPKWAWFKHGKVVSRFFIDLLLRL